MGRAVSREARGLHSLRVMPGAAVRLPEPDWGQMGKLNICRPVPPACCDSETTRWTDGQKAGVFLRAHPEGWALRGVGGGRLVFMLPLSCLISIFESIFVQVLSAGKNVCSLPTWGRDQAGHGGCSLVASLRERRGWAPQGLEQGFNLSGGFLWQPCCRPQNSLCPSPVHTETPHSCRVPLPHKDPSWHRGHLRSPGLPGMPEGLAKVPAKCRVCTPRGLSPSPDWAGPSGR